MWRSLTILTLAGLLIVQVVVKRTAPGTGVSPDLDGPPARLLTGDTLDRLGGGAIGKTVSSTCVVVYLANPLCPGCRALAASADSIGNHEEVWIMEGGKVEVDRFIDDFGIPSEQLRRLSDFPATPNLSSLGVYATPTSAILLPDRTLARVRVSTARRHASEVDECRMR